MEDTQFGVHTETEIEAELTTLLHALRTARRRRVVRLVHHDLSDECISTRWLARQIAGKEHNIAPIRVTGQQYKNVYNALSQTHLPTLSEAGIIVYDSQRQEVSSGPVLTLAVLLLNLIKPVVKTFYS